MRRYLLPAVLFMMVIVFSACSPGQVSAAPGTGGGNGETAAGTSRPENASTQGNSAEGMTRQDKAGTDGSNSEVMKMMIDGTEVSVQWEENGSVKALRELLKDGPLSIQMSMYGGFEQVGPLGENLPRNDVQTTTSAGDIVLYAGNQIVVFYGSNSWAYTRLGKITDKPAEALAELLGNGDVTITVLPG